MKTLYTAFSCLFASLFFFSCTDKLTEELRINIPIYMDYETLRSSVQSAASRELTNPGKIYFKGNYLMVVEYLKGVHVIDVSNPANPQNKVFVEIPGCADIAVKDNTLYADSYIDLVTIDISDMMNPRETGRIENVFSYMIPAVADEKLPVANIEQENGVVIGWEIRREKRDLELVNPVNIPVYPEYDYVDKIGSGNYYTGGGQSGSGTDASAFGKGGSMARFGLYDRYLYVASTYTLYLFDVQNAAKPVKAGAVGLNGTVETLFIYDDHLFFGTQSGMLVYSLDVPSLPVYLSNFWHVTSCDPVVIQDDYAFITLRGGTTCNNSNVNRLDVVKLSADYKQYELVNSYNMTEPYGLGIDGNTLFVCDGRDGLKIYDATDKKTITDHPLAAFPEIHAYDLIPTGEYLFMIGSDGFYLYNYTDIKNIRQIGYIPVVVQAK